MARLLTSQPKPAIDINQAKRLKFFRINYISKNQTTAAEMIDFAQGTLSQMENGQRSISAKLLFALAERFDLNQEWFRTGAGEPRKKVKEQPSAKNSLQAAHAAILQLENAIKLYEARTNRLFDIIENMEKRIEKLEQKS